MVNLSRGDERVVQGEIRRAIPGVVGWLEFVVPVL